MENNFNEKYDQAQDEANKEILDKSKKEMEKQDSSKSEKRDEEESEEDKQRRLQELVLDKHTKVCLCKAIPRLKIKEAIANGADTVEKVQKATGAGSGGCGGRRCTPKIQELLEKQLNQ